MSDLRLIIRDDAQEIHLDRDQDFVECVVAALSAEPETIEELDVALERFIKPEEWSHFCGATIGVGEEPCEAGTAIVDLPARLVVSDRLFTAEARDETRPDSEDEYTEDDSPLQRRLSGDWLLSSDLAGWRALAEERRRERKANPPIDARAVVYGEPLLEFVGRACWETFRDRPPLPDRDDHDDDADESAFRAAYHEEYELIRAIHVRWMMSPRDDLRSKTPRDVMVAKRDCISWDMQDRSMQWSHEGHCPRGIDPQSAAYRFAGFGTHELVMYYDMVRHLLWACRTDAADFLQSHDADALTTGDFLSSEVPQLALRRDEWLDSPDPEFHGRTPRSIIHNERARLPEGVSGAEAIIDHDCPLCQMQAELPGPMFWNLDGCNIDDDFAFSFHNTLEEWEAEQREYEEFNRRFEAKEAERKRLGVEYPGGGNGDPDYVWERSYSASESAGESALMRLFAIGSHLTEVIVELKEASNEDGGGTPTDPTDLSPTSREMIDRLSRDFGNLREIAQSRELATVEALVEPVLDRFCESLADVAASHPKLGPKCSDLRTKLNRFLEPAEEEGRCDTGNEDDFPF